MPNKQQPNHQRRSDRYQEGIGIPRAELNKEAVFLQPWFLPVEIYRAIRRLLPYIHLFKMRFYFEDYGCIKCGKKNVLYQSNGFCESCGVVIRYRVKQALMRRLRKVGEATDTNEYGMDDLSLAEQILKHAKPRSYKKSSQRGSVFS